MPNETILIVDDEQGILELIEYNLKKEGYVTLTAATGETALKLAVRHNPQLIILDLMLPGVSGLDVCRKLKQQSETSDIPILMVTARSEDQDIILGLEMGADDYMTKPFSPRVMTARIRAILRRSGKHRQLEEKTVLRIHNIEIDPVKHKVFASGEEVALSLTEFLILQFLAANPGWVFSRNQIIAGIKGSDYPVTERSVDVQILGLRKKLGETGHLIETVRGIGYRMKDRE